MASASSARHLNFQTITFFEFHFFVANFLGTFFGASILVSMSIGLRVYVCIVLLAGEAASEGYSCKKVEDCEYFGCRCIAISV